MHSTRVNGDVPPSLVFIQQVSQAIFSCEYFRGKPLRRYGNFGPQLKINGHKLFAGWGYAITDGSNSFTELINAQNFATFYKDFGKVKLNVNEGPLTVGDYDKKLRAFFVEVRSRYIIGTKTIAALGMFSFYKSKTKYRLFLWVQDYDLTRSEIAQRFGGMMELIVVPKTSIAEVKE
ncbi:hypothetical protein HQ403_00750 [Candidatus Kaiserbacteria bacterium]|nr:hypothetical protein [Candidatus Kaiserbacteria bacterium]